MNTLNKNYTPEAVEHKWYQHWEKSGYFHSEPDERPAYTIVIPPPNVTGVLHMGHALNNTVQDILIRRAKMQGFNTCWVPGTDHASIATEAKVVAMLREKGIDKNKLSREAFLKYAWEWKEKYGGIILQQFKKLGLSLDWKRTAFTMDKDYYNAVIRVFVELHNKGYIYRGVKMINWDPTAKTALSDEEVVHKETQSKLYYVRYKIEDSDEYITIATVRPETILGDTAICVHPHDPRYHHLKGKYCFVPLINRRIPIIEDDYIDLEFGTGALKVTPAHDINDYNLGLKHKLAIVDTLNEDGTLSEAAQMYIGEDRFVVRKKIIADLEVAGHLVKTEDYTNQVGYSERTNAVIEPRLSMQWWCRMQDMAKPALHAITDGEISFHPSKYVNLYKYWMENIKDWCVSRQLRWGHRIPAWYDEEGNIYVAENEEKAIRQSGGKKLRQDEDVLDTWFSSWLWPMEVFDWNKNPDNKALQYYYPTNTLVTAPEIIFFWVARMIMAGYEFKNQKPFDKVYFTGIVRDKQGRKMSKSLGNSPDLLQLIEQYGADAVRFSVMISSPAGNDLLYDENSLDQGRNFNNKIWNALKLVTSWSERTEDTLTTDEENFAIVWMEARIQSVSSSLAGMFEQFRLSEALKSIYSLIWDDFCSWYLEWIKPAPSANIAKTTYEKTIGFFEDLLQLLHPFMPFITEELYHQIKSRDYRDDLMVKQLPQHPVADKAILEKGIFLQNTITQIRDARNKHQIKNKEAIQIHIETSRKDFYTSINNILQKQVNATDIQFVNEAVPGIAIVVDTDKLYLVHEGASIDKEQQKALLEKELDYLKGFLKSVQKKLSNEKFVQNAKQEVVNGERKKMADAEAKIKTLEESLRMF